MHAHCIVVLLALFTIPLSFALISVDTPLTAAACQPVELTWLGGIEPWLLSIVSASPPNPALDNLGSATELSYLWTVDVAPGNSVIFVVQDSTGDSGQSSPFTIQQGTSIGGHCTVGASKGGQAAGGGGISNAGGAGNTSASDGGSGSDTGTNTGSAGSAQGSVSQPSSPDPSSKPASTPNVNSTPTPTSSSSSSTFTFSTVTTFFTQSASSSNSLLSSSDPALGSLTHSLTDPGNLGNVGQTQSSTTVVQTDNVLSTGTGQSTGSTSSFAKNNNVKMGSIIGGVIVAVLCALLAAFCVTRRCRRRRKNYDGVVYPFGAASASEASIPREMVGRSGYAPSTFSSWGNHGDLADESALSPTSAGVTSTESPPWEGHGTIESRYAAAFTPGHTASSSSIDRNDPTAQRRFRGPIPKNMMDALHPGPAGSSSSANLVEQPQRTRPDDANPVPIFDEVRPQEMPSWGRQHDVMAGRHPVVVGYPPPYTSK